MISNMFRLAGLVRPMRRESSRMLRWGQGASPEAMPMWRRRLTLIVTDQRVKRRRWWLLGG
jgi:hypothetical protein